MLMRPGLPGTGLLLAGSFLVALSLLTWCGDHGSVAAPAATISEWPQSPTASAAELYKPAITAMPTPKAADDSADDIPDIPTAKADATMALDPADRILAIQVLADDTSRESFDTLLTAVTAAPDPRERATAISSLRQRTLDDGDDVKIRNAMQAATYDPDPLVVTMAQSVLAESAARP